ncbi:hypothetical protein [Nostoc sp.]|uniref:hypothetical protein n=1 Tax=Nostoc sp. TaxID=1180 RepID=UPI002FF60599
MAIAFSGAVCVSSYEDIRILTHIISSFGMTCVSIGRSQLSYSYLPENSCNRTSLTPAFTAMLSLSWYWR